jgi:hypothetical protein
MWIARVVAAAVAATGEEWSGCLSPDLELCLGCGVAFTWTGSTVGNAFAGWVDGAAPAAPDSGYLLTGAAGQSAERLCAAKTSWPILHPYRMISTHPGANPVSVASPYRTPAVDYDVTLYVGQSDQSPYWAMDEICYYRGTATEISGWVDTDGWVILRPLDTPEKAMTPLDGWAGTIAYRRRYTRVAA